MSMYFIKWICMVYLISSWQIHLWPSRPKIKCKNQYYKYMWVKNHEPVCFRGQEVEINVIASDKKVIKCHVPKGSFWNTACPYNKQLTPFIWLSHGGHLDFITLPYVWGSRKNINKANLRHRSISTGLTGSISGLTGIYHNFVSGTIRWIYFYWFKQSESRIKMNKTNHHRHKLYTNKVASEKGSKRCYYPKYTGWIHVCNKCDRYISYLYG